MSARKRTESKDSRATSWKRNAKTSKKSKPQQKQKPAPGAEGENEPELGSYLPVDVWPRPHDGIVRSAPRPSDKDGRPSWPFRPFDKKSESFAYANWAYPEADSTRAPSKKSRRQEGDPRKRYDPSFEEVAAFWRWDIDLHLYDPGWLSWRGRLLQDFDVKSETCQSFTIWDVVQLLNVTERPDETNQLADAIATLAERYRAACQEPNPSERHAPRIEEGKRWIAYQTAGLLLKAHNLPRQFQVLGGTFPGGITQCEFFQRIWNVVTDGSTPGEVPAHATVLSSLSEHVRPVREAPVFFTVTEAANWLIAKDVDADLTFSNAKSRISKDFKNERLKGHRDDNGRPRIDCDSLSTYAMKVREEYLSNDPHG